MTFLNEVMVTDGGGSGNKQAVDSDGAALVKFTGEGGLATEAAQATGNASLASIDGKLTDVAQETGGNLDAIAAKDFATETTLADLNAKVTAVDTGAIAGTVTANAGTNLNTSALALEGGGNLEATATATAATQTSAASIDTKLTGVAEDGTDATGVVMPTGGVGIRGWLSSIFNLLNTVIGTFSQATATGGCDVFSAQGLYTGAGGNALLTNSAVAVKASAGSFYGLHTNLNINGDDCYVLLYGIAFGSVTVGTTQPICTIPVPSNGYWDKTLPGETKAKMASALSAAVVMTDPLGDTAPDTPFGVDIFFK